MSQVYLSALKAILWVRFIYYIQICGMQGLLLDCIDKLLDFV